MGAKTKPQEAVSVADVGVATDAVGEAGARTTVLEIGARLRGDSITIEDDGSAAQKILDLVVERKLV
jgi:electron transfer flavoprotein alpha/beta subunit